MFYDVFTILPLTCAIFVSMFGLFVLFKDIRSRMNQLMFAFNVCMFFWLFGTFMMFVTRGSVSEALFWDRFVYLGVIMMPPLMQHFSLIFTKNNSRAQKIILAFNYLIAIGFEIASRTPYFVDKLYVYSWGAHSQARILHTVFLGYFFLGVGIFLTNLVKFYKKTRDKMVRTQVVYVFLAFASVMFIGGTAYLYAYGIDTKFPFAYFTGLLFPIMLFYAVSRHHLLGTKMIATEVLIGAAEFFVVLQIFMSASAAEIIIRVIFAILTALMGFLLVKSVQREIKRREEVTVLARSLEAANAQLKELDQQKTEFLSIASHQLRTPLSIAKGYIELIEDGAYGKAGPKMIKVLDKMDVSNEHLVKLVDEFLDITHIEQGQVKYDFAEKNICEITDDVIHELAEKAAQKGLKINWACPRERKNVFCDGEKIRHVLLNFVDNAIKYSDKGTVAITLKNEDKGVAFRVKDNGLGFDKADEAGFFQKFYRGNNVKGVGITGTGLGLFVCRKFIEAHEGKVWAHSDGLGKGSEFGFWIPLAQKR